MLSFRPLPRALAVAAGLALFLLAAGVAAARPAHAANTITVNLLSDANLGGSITCAPGAPCTLRAALERNDADGGGDAVTMGVPGQIDISGGPITIAHSVTVTGGGHGVNTLNGGGTSGVFFQESITAQVAISGFTIIDAGTGENQGGAILNLGHLTLTDVVIKGGSAGIGGAIADFGTLTLASGDQLIGNSAHTFATPQGTAGGIGGGIAEFGKLTATGALFSGNTAVGGPVGEGGNVALSTATVILSTGEQFVTTGTATIAQSTFAQGTAVSGGGLLVDVGASASVTTSTFASNSTPAGVPGAGAAILNVCGALTLANDTFDGNHADEGFGGALHQECESENAQGVGPVGRTVRRSAPVSIQVPGSANAHVAIATTPSPTPTPTPAPTATAALDFVTMANNTAAVIQGESLGSTISDAGDLSTVTVHDSIIAKKAGDPGLDCAFFGHPTFTSQGYNLESANDCGFTATGDQSKVDPQLGALANNGGPTQTMALSAGTPAVDNADPRCDVTTDQRGVSRPQPQGGRCDIGAFELQVGTQATPTPLPSPPVTGHGRTPSSPPLIALILALLAAPVAGVGLVIARRRTT